MNKQIYEHLSGVKGYFNKKYRVTGTWYNTILVDTFDGRQFYAPEHEWKIIK